MGKLNRTEVEAFERMLMRKAAAGEVTDADIERLEQAQKDLASIVTDHDDRTDDGTAPSH